MRFLGSADIIAFKIIRVTKKTEESAMDRIEEICDKIGQCDDNIIEQLVARMRCIQDIIEYKKEKGIPILQPEQEKSRRIT